MSERLVGKNAIVTGAGAGVGRAAALRFVEEGARVAVADRDLDRARETVALLEAAGGAGIAIACDVGIEEDVVAMIRTAVDSFGSLDVLYNNAGIPTPRLGMKFEDHTAEDFHRLVAVNFGGVFFGCKHAVKQFKAQSTGGVILNTGSVAGLVSWGGSVYGSTKAAVHLLTKAVAIEGAPFGIRVNAICPAGMPYTRFMGAGGFGEDAASIEAATKAVSASHPLGKPITAEDCAEAAVFLCSDAAANITGVLLPIDGGYVAK